MTNHSHDDAWAALSSSTPLVLGAPVREHRLETDTLGALVAAIVGSVCLLMSALGVIGLWVAPLGGAAVAVAAGVTGIVVTVVVAGALSAWVLDRRGRSG